MSFTNDTIVSASDGKSEGSPFDGIMLLDHNGEERWSARDLQILMGYERWERFDDVVVRAKETISAAGLDPLDHFRGAAKTIAGGRWGKQSVVDYRLTRFGAYHVTLAGDGRKPEVAAAKTYFAVKTREAELATAAPAVPDSPEAHLALAQNYLAAATELVATKKELAVAAPKAGKWEAFCNSDGLIDMGTAAKALRSATGGLGRTKFMDRLREDDLHFLQVQNPRLPYEAHIKAGRAEVKMVEARHQWVEQTFLTPRGLDWLADKLAVGSALPTV
ncbi:phage antirepressor KilAC domain-containing protein [Streptomyces laculatispora]|uniref:phage antirepressor KilAC domain-containing protein n=1 Tax=Streptomyces laculatispora TaxID=887464 RepID=UPI001A9456AC|nr:phage antirepressor KilAC domain-containing protein [Streptomyces laculatispora]MBO0917549.1 phage antirepressor KilAC domain-containing protein [Streptomyces laculatispora]